MPGGVNIESESVVPDPGGGGGGPSPALLSEFQQIRAVGTDAGGNTSVTLDGTGRVVDLSIPKIVFDGGRRDVERGVLAAFDAAFEQLQLQREQQAQAALDSGRLQIAGMTADLQRLGEQADARLREVFDRLERSAARMTGSGS